MNNPLLIVMTPVRNEAWVLSAFLNVTSIWADYIIIADQMSNDGSRDIANSFDKVILIDNKSIDFNEAERQALLISKAREVASGRDSILFGLDADEIFSANFQKTTDWQRIINSKPGDVFWFKWAEICPNREEYWENTTYYPWMFHDDGKEPHKNYVKDMHSMRIPYPIDEKQMYYVNDFRVLHLAYLDMNRVYSKCRFYSFVDYELHKRSVIKLSRIYNYNKERDNVRLKLSSSYLYSKPEYKFDLWNEIKMHSDSIWFDQYILNRINNNLNKYRKIDIWSNQFASLNEIKDPRGWLDKVVHKYLRLTHRYSKTLIIRSLDKIIGTFYV